MQDEKSLIALVGPTASGKGTLARAIAPRLDAEILSVDSMKVYRGLDIGTAKPGVEARQAVAHHLIDLVDSRRTFSVAAYLAAAADAERDVCARDRMPLYVGGTALYLKALRHGMFTDPGRDPEYRAALRARAAQEGTAGLHAELSQVDPEAAGRIHANDLVRIVRALEVYRVAGEPISVLQTQFKGGTGRPVRWIGLGWERDALNRRIDLRVDRMFDAGLIEEVRALREAGALGATSRAAIGYREVLAHLEGKFTAKAARAEIQLKTRQFARRQLSWFRSFTDIIWIDCTEAADHAATQARAMQLIRGE